MADRPRLAEGIRAHGNDNRASIWQDHLWAIDPRGGPESNYRGLALLEIQGVRPTDIAEAVTTIRSRHAILRSAFIANECGELIQVVGPSPNVPIIRLPDDARRDDEEVRHLRSLGGGGWESPFDVCIFEGNGGPARLGISAHHGVWDAVSATLFTHELVELLTARLAGRAAALPVLPVQYGDYARWQRTLSAHVEQADRHWHSVLEDAPFAFEWPRSAGPDCRVAAGGLVRLEYEGALRLADVAVLTRTGLFAVAATAIGISLSLYTYQSDFLMGTPVTTRTLPELRPLIGFFVNTVPIRVRLDRNKSIAELIADIQRQLAWALIHSQIPVRYGTAYGPSGAYHAGPLRVLCQRTASRPGLLKRDGIGVEGLPVASTTIRYDATFGVDIAPSRFAVVLEYSTAMFNERSANDLLRYIEFVLDEIATDPGRSLKSVTLHKVTRPMCKASSSRLRGPWVPLAQRLRDALAKEPPRQAMVTELGRSMSAGQLLESVDGVAGWLVEKGASPERVVAIVADRSGSMIVGLLGVLATGATYWPIAIGGSSDRQQQMLDEVKPVAVLWPNEIGGTVAGIPSLSVANGLVWKSSARLPEIPPLAGFSILYTSGSTGRPKGVLNTQEAMLNRILWMQQHYRIDAEDAVLHKTPVTFDVSAWEILWPLLVGARLVVAKPQGHRDMGYLVELIQKERITTIHFVPSVLARFLSEPQAARCKTLKRVICSGEVLTPALALHCMQTTGAHVSNLYGPTEAAIDATGWDVEAGYKEQRIPIGRPIENVSVYVVDRELRPAAVGACGQIAISGLAPARGYVGHPEATASNFVPDPISGEPGARMYLTGDLGTIRPDGAIEFVRRADLQMKVSGVRIELTDVEDAIRQSADVAEVAVASQTTGSVVSLVAYIVPRVGAHPSLASVEALVRARFLVAALARVVIVDELPRTASGKIDRMRLRQLDPARTIRDEGAREWSSALESAVACAWKEVLRTRSVNPWDNFFDLGGQSVSAMQVLVRLERQLGWQIPIEELFHHPVLREFATHIASTQRAVDPLGGWPSRTTGQTIFPTSSAQQRLWFVEQLAPGTPMFNMAGRVQLTGPLDSAALIRAITYVVKRHEILRTSFHVGADGLPVQALVDDWELDIRISDFSQYEAPQRTVALSELARETADQPFQLDHAPLLRSRLAKMAGNEHLLLVTLHHIICDAWSISILMREFTLAYSAIIAGRELKLPAVRQYAEYALWEAQWIKTAFVARQIDHWVKVLTGSRPTLLRGDFPTGRSAGKGAVRKTTLGAPLVNALTDLAASLGVTMFMLLLAAFVATLSRLGIAQSSEVLVATGVAHRRRPEFEEMIGLFVNLLPLRIPLRDTTFAALLAAVRDVSVASFGNQDAPFEVIARTLKSSGQHRADSPIDLAFVFQNVPRYQAASTNLRWELLEDLSRPWTAHGLHVIIEGTKGGMTCYVSYATDRFRPETVDAILVEYSTMLETVIVGHERPTQPDSRFTGQ